MTELGFLKELLSSGANGAMIGVLYFLWRLDRRVMKLETKMELKDADGI